MKKIAVATILSVFFMLGVSWAEKPFIDPELEKVDVQIDKEIDECAAKVKNPHKKIQCVKEIRRKYEAQGVLRGTDRYCEEHYGKLSFKELEAVLARLQKEKDGARTSPPPGERLPGEVVFGRFDVEQIWIRLRLGEMQRENYKEQRRKTFKDK